MIRLKHICIFGGLLVVSMLQSWGQSTPVGDTQMYANYELAQRFQAFSLGGKLNNNSLRLYPNEINDTDNFWFDFTTSTGKHYYYVNPKEAKKELLFDNTEMAMQLTELTHDVVNSARIDLNGIEFSKDQKTFTFRYNSKKYEYSRLTRKLKEVQEEKVEKEEGPIYSWMNFSPDKKYILYAKEHNLYVRGNKALGVDTTEIQLTTDGVEYFSYAKEEPEGDNGECRTNARWCPDSRHAYIVLDDERKLRNFWVINSLSERPSLKSYKYEFPGDKYVTQNELVIIDVVERTAKKAKVQKWVDQYVAPLHVTSDSKLLFFERTKRTWDEVDFCSVNLSTMEVKELIHEVDKPYRDPHARNSEVLNNGKDILFRSERTGWGHYYHYDGDGNLKNALSSGPWVSGHIVTVDSAARKVYFYGYGEDPNINPFYYRLYKADLDKGGATLISKEDGQHNVHFLKSKRYYVDSYSRVDMVPKILLKDNTGKTILDLATPDLKQVFAEGWKMPERFVVKAADNLTNLYGVMWKPSDFDPNKKYPVISVVYPGPYFGFVPTNFSLEDRCCNRMAQLGFIVIAVGHRGDTPMRGKAYHRFGYGKMRDYPLADDKYAIEQLAKVHPYIDVERVGIYGHSGGGFMAAAAIFMYPDFYKAAVSCSGNHDNNIYNRGWGECYNGVREVEKIVKDSLGNERKEIEHKFSVESNATIAKNLKGHLLLVTGDMDTNVNPTHTYRVAQALIEAGKNFEMLVIPGAGHGYGSADDYFENKMFRFFAKYLIGDDRADGWGDMTRIN
jgi:dipeptidyl-peptidase-4